MNINYIYNVNSEINRVKDTFRRKDHYLEYEYKVSLPGGLSLNDSLPDNLETLITAELDDALISSVKESISASWDQYQSEIINLLGSINGDIPKDIDVVLTQYGVGGSYWPPEKIILNVNYKNYFKHFVHELIHLCIEKNIIQKHNLDHKSKEGMVDWVFLNSASLRAIFPEYEQQKLSVLPSRELIEQLNIKL